MSTPDLLTAYESCDLRGYWARDWQRKRLDATDMLRRAITAGVTESEREDFGQLAGETMMELAEDPGMETPSSRSIYESVVHHAALADMLTGALRKPDTKPWAIPPPTTLGGAPWASRAFLDPSGDKLRAVVLASSWGTDRHYREVQSWYALGEAAAYSLPIQLVVLRLGEQRDGRRTGTWTQGFLHPRNHKLRFRKKSRSTFESFNDRWEKVWREDRGEITNRQWMQAMLDDDILRDACFTVDIPQPSKSLLGRIQDIAARKLDTLYSLGSKPEPSLSLCQRCQFRGCCWSEEPYPPSEKAGFVRIKMGGDLGGTSNDKTGLQTTTPFRMK